MTERVLETVTGPDTLTELQHTLDLVWAAEEVPDYTRLCMDLAVSEIGTNIIEHSGSGQPMQLRMVVTLLPDTVSVVLSDDGHPIVIDLSQTAMPGDFSDRGRGLAIAHRVLDELRYTRNDAGNRWLLMRRRAE
ncbi:MAG: ATP-binding protein [Mycobacterium sp.]